MSSIQETQDIYKKLTNREIEIVKMAAEGMSMQMIADNLCIAKKTVGVHRHNIYKKLGCGNMAGAVAVLLRSAIIS